MDSSYHVNKAGLNKREKSERSTEELISEAKHGVQRSETRIRNSATQGKHGLQMMVRKSKCI